MSQVSADPTVSQAYTHGGYSKVSKGTSRGPGHCRAMRGHGGSACSFPMRQIPVICTRDKESKPGKGTGQVLKGTLKVWSSLVTR